ncbi:hypothetical protein ACUXV3_03765 [Roseobacteraceae bacterium NS-SX3]
MRDEFKKPIEVEEVLMKIQAITDDQLAELVRSVTLQVIEALTKPAGSEMPNQGKLEKGTKLRERRRRSNLTAQLNIRVRPEDEVWFRELAEESGVKNGMLFHLMRQRFEESECGKS